MTTTQNPENINQSLTGIHPSYTLAVTPTPPGGEADQLAVNNFLEVLAEVAVNIAARRKRDDADDSQPTSQESNH